MVLSVWNLRPSDKNEVNVDYKAVYASDPNIFSLKIHHGGMFSDPPRRRYINGNESFIDNVDVDLFSVIELNDVVMSIGYSGDKIMYYQFMIPDLDLDNGLRALGGDQDVQGLIKYVLLGHRLINVYIEHEQTRLDTYKSSSGKTCTIVELEDDAPVPRSKVAKQLMLEWNDKVVGESSVNVVGESSTANEMGKNIVPSEFTTDFYSTLDNEDFDPFLGLDDDEVVDKLNEVEQTLEMGSQDEDVVVKGKKPIVYDEDEEEHSGSEDSDEDEEEQSRSEDSEDEEDSDYISDEVNDIDEVEVDMEDFHANVDPSVEFMGSGNLRRNMVFDDHVDVDIEALDNDEFDSGSEGDDDMEKIRKRKLKMLRKQQQKTADGSKVSTYFYVGRTFGTAKEAKDMIKLHSIETRRQLFLKKNDKVRIRAECSGTIPTLGPSEQVGPSEDGPSKEAGSKTDGSSQLVKWTRSAIINASPIKKKAVELTKSRIINGGQPNKNSKEDPNKCPWALQIGKGKDGTWSVRTYKAQHKCLQTRKVKACTADFLAKEIVRQITTNPEIPIRAVQDQSQKKYKLEISRMKAFRAKSKARSEIRGDHSKQYATLRDYVLELKANNPNTNVKIKCEHPDDPEDNNRVFQRIYICIGALKQGFKAGKRDLLGFDGTFMKGPFPGQLLTAVSLDPNNGIYPLAYCIAEAENKESWTWFLEQLGEDLGLQSNSNFTFISDRQKGIIPAIAKLFPVAEHRYCLKHIHENMKQKWNGKVYKDMLWKCASSTTVQHFNKAMDDLKKFNKEAYDWLCKILPHHWSRSHFSGRAKSDVLLNNMCEVFNGKLVEGRDIPIISALEYIIEYLMRRIMTVNKLIAKCDGPLTPTATRLPEMIKQEAADYVVSWNGDDMYQVTGGWFEQYVVNISQRSCTCRYWEITGIPCKHAVAVNWNMATNNMNPGLPEEWVHPCYRLDTWKQVYSHKIRPINGPSMWPKCNLTTTIIPPKHHAQPGRLNKKRKRSATEMLDIVKNGKLSRKLKSVTCVLCKEKGHNKRTCKGPRKAAPTQSAPTQPASSQHASQTAATQATPSQAASSKVASQKGGAARGKKKNAGPSVAK